MKKYILLNLLLLVIASCTNLDETLYSRIDSKDFYKTEDDINRAMGPIYANFREILQWHSIWDSEATGDISIIPTRIGGAWYDEGIFQRLHKHTWMTGDSQFARWWEILYTGVNNCNRVLYQIEESGLDLPNKDKMIAEIKIVRAMWYYYLFDIFGNVPLVDKYDVPDGWLPETASRADIYKFIEKELLENIDKASEDKVSTYGKMNKWSGKMLLARLYLNAEATIGENRYAEAIKLCDDIINSGQYELLPVFEDNFVPNNEGSVENIFAYPMDNVQGLGMYVFCEMTFIGGQNKRWDAINFGGHNGACVLHSFIDSYDPDDKRIEGSFLSGVQKDPRGNVLTAKEGGVDVPLSYRKEVTSLTDAKELDGYRNGKYLPKMNQIGASCDNDFQSMRYAEVLFTKAECILRTGGNADEAASLVNQVRKRAFDTPHPVTGAELAATINVNNVPVRFGRMLQEWGWEFAIEGMRRTQLIRFDNNFIKGSWPFHEASNNVNLNLFPIPSAQRVANPNLKQNPGYPD
nr:RagB/SusD family nutrient uptake outer membrane protein [Parabacteroides goldsteinii]